MALIQLNDVTIGFRGPPLLDGVSCQIEPNQRIGLLGRNGAGKTTLMRMIAGEVEPDAGELILAPGAAASLLPQDVPRGLSGTIREVVAQGVPGGDAEDAQAWKVDRQVDAIMTKMQLDGEREVAPLSSGMKRRVLLARALVAEPDVLLLDEPTNHLDVDSIAWLEEFLVRWPATLLFVTHDRAFLRRVANRILEIDRGRIFDWSCDYATFLVRKEAALDAEAKQAAAFDKKLAQEEAWIRQGIKARRTRNEGRVRALEAMRRQRAERRANPGAARIEIQESQRSGALVADAEGLSFAYGDHAIVDDFSISIMRGDKIGLIGPNGAGKTTLLRLLLGQLAPTAGKLRLGTNLEIAYFDQLRERLDDEETVQESIADGADNVMINGRSRHVIGYLQDFLFTPERARTPIRFLSGGERNRVLLARLFSKPANVLVMDEPTNDLDAETLELLEDRLVDYEGTLLVVSHDREFLNNVVTSTIAFEPGGPREYVGGYDDWVRQRQPPKKSTTSAKPDKQPSGEDRSPADRTAKKEKRLSYREGKELESLPGRIEELDSEIAALHAAMAAPEFYQQNAESISASHAKLQALDAELAAAYERWEELEQKSA